jgi:uncharacterized protein (TIGR00369 family)
VTEETGQTPWIRERDAVVERMLAGGGRPGVTDPALRSGKTGLELLRAMLRGELPFPPIAETLDFSLISVEAGKAVFQSTPQFKHYNPLGSVHGGWYATLLDSALGCAVQSMLPAGYSYTTVELGMNIVRLLICSKITAGLEPTTSTAPAMAESTLAPSSARFRTAAIRLLPRE